MRETRGEARRPSRRWATLAAGTLIVLAGAAAYSNSFHGPFVLDDLHAIRDNPTIRHLGAIGPVLWEARSATVVGRPVLNLSLAVNYALGELDVRGYHLFNLAAHLAAGLMLFGVVRRTLLLAAVPERFRSAATALALAVALLWTVHPLQTESVTYVVQRAESLAGLFYLATLYGLIRGASSRRPAGWHVAAVATCLLGMGSKEVVVSAPLVAILYDRTFLAGSFREALRRRWGLYAALAATGGLLAVLVVTSAGRADTAGFGHGLTWWEYARTQFGFIVHYLRLAFWPDPLVFDYGTAVAQTSGEIVPYAAIVALLLGATVVALRRWPWAGLLGVWFFATLAPSSSFIPLITQMAAEHRMYLPLAAVVALVVILGYHGWQHLLPRMTGPDGRRGWPASVAPAVALAAVAGSLAFQTFLRNRDYRSTLSLWEDTARKRPENGRAHSNLGVELAQAGIFAGALREFDQAIALRPGEAAIYNNRGTVYHALGQYDRALEDYGRAIALKADFAQAYVNRGKTCQQLRRYDLAIQDYDRAVVLMPDYAKAYRYRAIAYFSRKQYDRAWADADTCRRLGGEVDPAFIRLLSEASGRTR